MDRRRTGGAGYIGTVVAAELVGDGHEVTVLGNLSTGLPERDPHAMVADAGAFARTGSAVR